MPRIITYEFVLVIALGVFWGLNWPSVKVLLTELGPWTLRAIGLSFGAAGLAVWAMIVKQSLVPRPSEIIPLLVAGLLSILGFNVLTAFGQLLTETSSAVIVAFTMPMWAALFSVLILAEMLTMNRLLALVLGMCGLAVLVFGEVEKFVQAPAGPLFMLGAALSWAAGTVALKSWTWSIGAIARAAWMVGVSAVPTVICAFVFEAPAEQAALSLPVLAVLVYHIGFPMIVCHAVWVSLVGRLPASVAAIATLLIPVVGVISAALLLGDELGTGKLVALSLVLLSVALTFFQWGGSSRSQDGIADQARGGQR
ncbi:MAG: DMT family transporter [Hyphomicrobiaceae bacterium]